MKKSLNYLSAIIVSLVAVSACQKAEFTNVEKADGNIPNFSISASQSGAKTYFEKDGDVYNSFWNGPEGVNPGDQIRVFLDSNDGYQCTYKNTNTDGALASFEYKDTQVEKELTEGKEYTIYGFHRSGRFLKVPAASEEQSSTTVAVEITASQTPRYSGPDKSQDFLIMKPVKYTHNTSVPSKLESNFARVQAVIRVTFDDQTSETLLTGRNVNSISFASKNNNLAGAAYLELAENGGFVGGIQPSYKVSDTKTVAASKKLSVTYSGAENYVVPAATGEMFFNTVPATYSGDEFTIVAIIGDSEAGKYKITKTISPASITFKAGKIVSIKLTVEDENVSAAAPFDGEGTNDSPYLIKNETDLRKLSELTNGEEADDYKVKVYKQVADITLSNDNFTPIAQTTGFNGIYNGNDKTISNMHIAVTSDVSNVGLFGQIGGANAKVMKLTLDGAVVSTSGASNYVGIVVGYATGGTIDRCYVKNSSNTNVKSVAKGLILGGSTSGTITIKDCKVSNSSVSISPSASTGVTGNCVGGIAGRIGKNATITGCVVGSDCTITSQNYVGGIVGAFQNVALSASIDKCVCYADINANHPSSSSNAGGIVGAISNNDNNTNQQNVVISNCAYIGGTITSSYTGSGNTGVGGIVGKAGDGAQAATTYDIINCVSRPASLSATGTKANSGSTNWGVGGIIGASRRYAAIYGCYCGTDEANMKSGAAPKVGSVTPKLNGGATAQYCFGKYTLVGDTTGNSPVNSEVIEDMTASTFLTKLNDAKTAYTGGKATLVDWVAGSDSYPTLSGILADPDAK